MKKQKVFKYIILFLALHVTLSPLAVFASDVSSAQWNGTVQVSNNGTATSGVSVNCSIDSSTLISNGYATANMSDIALQMNGTDVAVMPGYDGSAWVFWVGDIGASQNVNYDLYTGGASEGKIRYFPGSAGMTTSDAASLELGDNFTITQSGYFDATIDDYLYFKSGGIGISGDGSGNITAAILGEDNWLLPDIFSDPSTAWTDEANAYDSDNTTYAYTTAEIAANSWSEYLYFTFDDAVITTEVKYVVKCYPVDPDDVDVDVYNGSWQDVFQGEAADNTWYEKAAVYSGVTQARIRVYNGHDTGTRTGYIYEFQVNDVNGEQVSVVASGLSSGEPVIEIGAHGGEYTTLADNDSLLHFTTDNSSVDCGAIHNAATKFWLSFRFMLDDDFTAASADQYIFGKYVDAANYYFIMLRTGTGKLRFLMKTGGNTRFDISSTETSWNSGQIYHAICSTSNTTGTRLIVDNGTPVTDADLNALPNGGNLILGDRASPGIGSGLDGVLMDVFAGTDDLTSEEEANLYAGIPPDDAVNIWLLDEGSGATAIDYGTGGNDGTIDATCTWVSGERYVDFYIDVDGDKDGANLHGNSVPDNSNDIISFQNYVMPYVEYQEIEVDGVQVQYIAWEYDTTFTDSSGNGNDATPTFRTTSSDADVSAELTGFRAINESEVDTFSLSASYSLLTGDPTEPDNMFSDSDYSKLPADPINEILEDAEVPQAAWWFPFLFLGICVVGLMIYGATSMTRGANGRLQEGQIDGSLLAMFIIIEALLVALGKMGPIPYWPAYLFPVAGVAIILSRKHFSWG